MENRAITLTGKVRQFLVAATLLAAVTTPALAQWRRLELGIETGIPWNDAAKIAAPSRYALTFRDGRKAFAGITAETPLRWGLAIRGSVLFKPQAFHLTLTGTDHWPGKPIVGVSSTQPFRDWWNLHGNAWEFPVTVKKRLVEKHRLKPFVNAGVAFRYTDATVNTQYEVEPFISFGPTADDKYEWRSGPTIGAGVDIDLLPVRLSPQVRWTNWLGDGRIISAFGEFGQFGPARNALDFQLTFGIKKK